MSNTTNYFFNRPVVGGSSNSWGGDLNENWSKLDQLLHGASYTDSDANTVEKIQPDLNEGNWAINGTAVTATASDLNKLASTGELGAVTATGAELNKLDGCTATTAELNHVSGVTSAIQTQLDNLTNGTTTISTIDMGNWTITETSGVLYFSQSGTNYMKLDASGNLTVRGDVTAKDTSI